MRTRIQDLNRMIASAACFTLIAIPVFAGDRDVLVAPTGITYEVWDQRDRTFLGDSSDSRSSIRYAVIEMGSRIEGVVNGTEDAALDIHPRLALDPSTNEPVLVWSRWDGVYQKIAYSRFSGVHWRSPEFVTYGPGDDRHPRIGVASNGGYLFWISKGDHYMHAPFDIAAGHLLAAGRQINPSYSNDSSLTLYEPSTETLEGNTDAPIIGSGSLCTRLPNGRCRGSSQGPTQFEEPNSTIQGNSDVPIILIESQAMLWAIASHPGCRSQVIAVPGDDIQSLAILSFQNGAIHLISRLAIPTPIPDGYGELAASSFLPGLCD